MSLTSIILILIKHLFQLDYELNNYFERRESQQITNALENNIIAFKKNEIANKLRQLKELRIDFANLRRKYLFGISNHHFFFEFSNLSLSNLENLKILRFSSINGNDLIQYSHTGKYCFLFGFFIDPLGFVLKCIIN